MYDNPEIVPEYPNGSVEPTGDGIIPNFLYNEQPQIGLCSKLNTNELYGSVKSISNNILNSVFIEIVPDPLREYADTLEQYTSILQAHADKKYGAYVIHYPKDRHPVTGEELDLIN